MLLVLLVLLGASLEGVRSQSTCGPPPEPLNATGSNVLIIGDSISMGCCWGGGSTGSPLGYGYNVLDILGQQRGYGGQLATVQHNGGWGIDGQASNTNKTLECVKYWVGNGTWDVISWNNGLHDLAEDDEHIPVEQYAENILAIAQVLLQHAKKVIFVTTTPVPDVPQNPVRTPAAVMEYNEAAKKALAGTSVIVNDLWAWVIARCGGTSTYKTCDIQRLNNVHFMSSGREYTGIAVAHGILQAIGGPV